MRDQQAGAGYLAELGPALAAGARIAGYWLEEQIGRGGMAVVFRARDERLRRLVALKVLAPALAGDEEFRQRFIRESRAAAAVDDPHIIPVFEAGEAAGALFIAMRFVPGGDVYSLVRRTGPLSASRAVAIVSPVASALDAAHAAGLVHRDVKPANMLLDTRPGRPDHVYLSDFGLSKGAVSTSTGLTGGGHFLGTLDYISPEQIEGERADGRADQYALACSAYEMLTGAPPFRSGEAAALMYAQLRQPPPALTSRRPDLPAAADQVLARALAKNPAGRYPTCRDFADALRAAFGLASYDSGPEAIPAAEHPPAPPAQPWPHAAAAPPGPQAAPAAPGSRAAPDRPARHGRPPAEARPGDAQPGDAQPGDAQPSDAQPSDAQPSDAQPGPPGRPGRRRRSRRALVGTIAAVAVLAAAVLVVHALNGPLTAARVGYVRIAAASGVAPLTGDDYVVYHSGRDSSARLHGTVPGASRGEVAGLYAQPFPYDHPPARAGSVVLDGTSHGAAYAFTVTPGLATRYHVELFPGRSVATPLARSPTLTLYVAKDVVSGALPACHQVLCEPVVHLHVFVPASAMGPELRKRWLTYSGLAVAKSLAAAQAARAKSAGGTSAGGTSAGGTPPRRLVLGEGQPKISPPYRISATEFGVDIFYLFAVGPDRYSFRFAACTPDTETQDGLGLPGRHGCGAKITTPGSYLG